MSDNLTKVGRYDGEYDSLLGITLPKYDIIQIGIKLDSSSKYLYAATLFDIKQGR